MVQKRNNKMNKIEKKRQKEQYVVEEMIRLYCRKKSSERRKTGGADVSRMSKTFGLCKTKKSEVSIYGRKDVLCEL